MNLTLFERFWLWRRRSGLNQWDAATVVGCSRATIQLIEQGKTSPLRWIEDYRLPLIPSPGEAVRVLRRRTRLTDDEFAGLIGVCRTTLNRIERGVIPLKPAELHSIERSAVYHLTAKNRENRANDQIASI